MYGMSIFSIERNINEWTYKAYNESGRKLSELMTINGGIGTDSFYWIKCEPNFPSFADFIFGYREKVFAVAVIRTRITSGHREIDSDLRGIAFLEEMSAKNDFIPCLMPINQDLTFLLPGWGLMNPGFVTKGENLTLIHPEDMGDDEENAEISPWELRNLASMTVRDEIRKTTPNIRGIMTVDAPVSPELIYYDENGDLNYVIIRYVVLPSTKVEMNDAAGIHQKMTELLKKHAHGHFTIVGFKSPESDGKLYRLKGIQIALNRIVPIRDEDIRKGTEILSTFRSLIETSTTHDDNAVEAENDDSGNT